MKVDGGCEVELASLAEHSVVSFTAVDYPTEQRLETKLGKVYGRSNSPDIATRPTAAIAPLLLQVGNELEESSPTIITTTFSSSLRPTRSSHPMRPNSNRRRSRKSKLGPKLYEQDEPQDDVELRKKIQNAKKAKDQRDRLKNMTLTLEGELEEVTKDRDRLASEKQGIVDTIIELERKMATCQPVGNDKDEEEKDDDDEGVQDRDTSELQVVCDTEQEQQQIILCHDELEIHPNYVLDLDGSGNLSIVDPSGSRVVKLPKSLLSTNFTENLKKHVFYSI